MRRSLSFRTILFSLLGLIVLLVLADIVLSKMAVEKLHSILSKSGVQVQKLRIDVLTRSLTIEGFEWRAPENQDSLTTRTDSEAAYDAEAGRGTLQVSFETIHLSWVDVTSFIRKKEVRIGSLSASGGKIIADRRRFQKSKSRDDSTSAEQPSDDRTSDKKRLPFSLLFVSALTLDKIDLTIKYDSVTEHQANIALSIDDILLRQPELFGKLESYSIGDYMLIVKDYHMSAQKSMYTLAMKEFIFDSKSKKLTAESIVLLPRYGKYKFSRQVGKQLDRFVLRVPKVELTEINTDKIVDSILTAGSLKIHKADLYVFRDKRLPFIKHHNTPLPVALIRSLAFGFALDSLLLIDTRIKYEEFPEKGFQTGYIIFDHLNANAAKVTNRDLYPDHNQTVLHVTSRIMGNGVINVDFTLPYDKAQVYNTRGRISNLRLETLNPMLESLAFIRIEKGRLNALDFNFSYDDFASRGEILLNYENLKIAGLTKDKEGKENDVKSLALNLFVKKDKDKEVPIEKRSGKIYYERDRRRAVFNVWVKSLFSGVKSSVVDPPGERKPQTRKEKRDSLRHIRKDNREKKKKERQEEKNDKRTEKSDSLDIISLHQ